MEQLLEDIRRYNILDGIHLNPGFVRKDYLDRLSGFTAINLLKYWSARKPDKTLYVQVCYLLSGQRVIEREFGNLLKIKDNHEKVVISLDEVKFSDYEGIRHLHPWELV